eukprot:PhF_6_TR40473/c0_g2_i1/m.60506
MESNNSSDTTADPQGGGGGGGEGLPPPLIVPQPSAGPKRLSNVSATVGSPAHSGSPRTVPPPKPLNKPEEMEIAVSALEVLEMDEEQNEHVELEVPHSALEMLQRHLWYIFASPEDSMHVEVQPWEELAQKGIQILSLLFVLLSVIGLCIDSLPENQEDDNPELRVIEILTISYFSFEIAVKIFAAPSKFQYLTSMMTLIDIISIIPFYIGFMVSGSGGGYLVTLRVVRLTRVFRVFKLSKYNQDIKLVFMTILRSRNAISLLVFLLAIAMTIFSALMYFAEQSGASWDKDSKSWIRDDGSISPFQSIPHSMWWCIVTLTTVGYGDAVPTTAFGKVVASLTMLVGVLVIAFPTMILGKNFNDVCQAFEQKKQELIELKAKKQREKEEREMREMQEPAGLGERVVDSGTSAKRPPAITIGESNNNHTTNTGGWMESKSPRSGRASPRNATPRNRLSNVVSLLGAKSPTHGNIRRKIGTFGYNGTRRYIHCIGGSNYEYSPVFVIGAPTPAPSSTTTATTNTVVASGDSLKSETPSSETPSVVVTSTLTTVVVPMILDDPAAHEFAYLACRQIDSNVTRTHVNVRQVSFMTIEKTNLSIVAPYATLVSSREFSLPGTSVPLIFSVNGAREAAELQKMIPFLSVTCKVYHSSPTQTTVRCDVTKGDLARTSLLATRRISEEIKVSGTELRAQILGIVPQLQSVFTTLSFMGPAATITNLHRVVEHIVDTIPKTVVDDDTYTLEASRLFSRDDDSSMVVVPSLQIDVADFGLFTVIDATPMMSSLAEDSTRQLVNMVRVLEARLEAHEGTRSS